MANSTHIIILLVAVVLIAAAVFWFTSNKEGELSVAGENGEALSLSDFGFPSEEEEQIDPPSLELDAGPADTSVNTNASPTTQTYARVSRRTVETTDGIKHSIPLTEILGGGPPKDGIPSIDDPEFESARSSDLDDDAIGIGIAFKGGQRFYPFEILVWHELVNDVIPTEGGNLPVVVTYCPLCQTGIVFDRRIDGEAREFGVSGQLWQSNLLMYDRTGDVETESLWSQVLGEAVVGPETGRTLPIYPSDIVSWEGWKKQYPNTHVLERPGVLRPYGVDPYGDYYENRDVGFGAEGVELENIHPKTFVHGIEVDGQYKAYVTENLPEGTMTDTLAGQTITIEKSSIGEVSFTLGSSTELPTVAGFWFSWAAVHPETEVWTGN